MASKKLLSEVVDDAVQHLSDQENGRHYREALERICAHLEAIAPSAYKMSSVWRIAKTALSRRDAR